MKIIRSLLLILSMLVITGHDIVPHQDGANDEPENSAVLPASSTSGINQLGHLLSHVPHGMSERELNRTHLTSCETPVKVKTLYSLLDFVFAPNLLTDPDLEKTFGENPVYSYYHYRDSFSLRGPPTC
ncbi:MAG: hypothetical protein V4520_11710 [Bacteroidota bacterium]